ncbi:hypothetical protein DICVIV_11765 [Dictyocaulus viviparus]|uniref:G-protein coupled receptors family 1 profile domain-containing protein n=1 Tax=Dictyocaulus viviparus TaxID=29172 RepID=A0A0D8XCC3_DICVI|nr:hypothetical protein DICVIV_11765 [Dictyocaulus viviparus]
MESKELDLDYSTFWYGLTNIVLSISLLILNVIFIIAIRWHKNFAEWTSYHIMFLVISSDIIQLISHTFAGVSLMLKWDMPILLNVFLASVLSAAWISTDIYCVLILAHRLLSVAFPLHELKYFHGKRKTVIFVLVNLPFLIIAIIQWTNWSLFKFHRSKYSWNYDQSFLMGRILYFIDCYSMTPLVMCSIICYPAINRSLKAKGVKKRGGIFAKLVNIYIVCCVINFITWRVLEQFHLEPIMYFWKNLSWILWNGSYPLFSICLKK